MDPSPNLPTWIPRSLFSRSTHPQHWNQKNFLKNTFCQASALERRELKGHFGCVNALEFSHAGGDLLASGGDDRRILLWRVDEAMGRRQGSGTQCVKPTFMVAEHHSNIFCIAFDNSDRTILSGGNDEQVIVHDVVTGDTKDVFLHEDAIYCLSVDPTNDNLFASACDDGTCQLYDLRQSDMTVKIANSSSPFHSVMHNPTEPRLFVTANGRDGAQLWDIRVPNSPLLLYGGSSSGWSRYHRKKYSQRGATCQRSAQQACMYARFDGEGKHVLVIRRRLPPALYDIAKSNTQCQFDHPGYYNSCTLKSCCFAGADDEYVVAGSDDFNVYVWKIPSSVGMEEDEGDDCWVGHAHHVLRGHRSIVNQVRFNADRHIVCSSGVEKVINLWTPFSPSEEEPKIAEAPALPAPTTPPVESSDSRSMFTHEEYINLFRTAGTSNHDYSNQSVEEDPRMIAFFDSLIQRELEGWSSDSSEGGIGPLVLEYLASDREPRATMEEEVAAEDLSRVVVSTPEPSSSNSSIFGDILNSENPMEVLDAVENIIVEMNSGHFGCMAHWLHHLRLRLGC